MDFTALKDSHLIAFGVAVLHCNLVTVKYTVTAPCDEIGCVCPGCSRSFSWLLMWHASEPGGFLELLSAKVQRLAQEC